MIKRFAFVAGFGIGFVVGSASGRKSYEALRESAVNTWSDPKVQAKVSEGAEWVKAEVPVVGGKLAENAQKAADTVTAKVQEGAGTVKEKAAEGTQAAKQKAEAAKNKVAEGTQAAKNKAEEVSEKDSSSDSSDSSAKLPKPVTTEKDVDMEPAHPLPDEKDMKKN